MKKLIILFGFLSMCFLSYSQGFPIGVDGSDLGVKYQLQLNGVDKGKPIVGTGFPISFGYQTDIGSYTVIATDTITLAKTFMGGLAIIRILPKYHITESVTINQGEVYNSKSISEQYFRIIPTKLGCDSIVSTNLIVMPNQ